MARVYVEELWEGREATLNSERQKQYARVFEVRTDDAQDGPDVAGEAGSGIPDIGDAHPQETAAYCIRVYPSNHPDDPTLWKITAEYDTTLPRSQAAESQGFDSDGESVPTPNPAQRPQDPVLRPAVYRAGRETAQEVIDFDFAGEFILNSAGDPFDPPITREVTYPVITITKCVASVSFSQLEQYQDSLNSDTWCGFAPHVCKLNIEWESAYENGSSFFRVTYTIKIRWKTWDEELIDRGYRELIPGSPGAGTPARWERIKDDGTGAYPSEPTLLDGFGRKLAAGEEPVKVGPFQIYRELPYAALGI